MSETLKDFLKFSVVDGRRIGGLTRVGSWVFPLFLH